MARRVRTTWLLAVVVVLAAAPPGAAAGPSAWRVNAGEESTPYIDSTGNAFALDEPYSASTGYGYIGGTAVGTTIFDGDLAATEDTPLYLVARSGSFTYRFDAPPGAYVVTIHACELDRHGRGLRSFDVRLNGDTWLDDLDVWDRVEKDYALRFRRLVTVDGAGLDVQVQSEAGPGLVAAIEVVAAPTSADPPVAPIAEVVGNYARNDVFWDHPSSEWIQEYRVERARMSGGPFTIVEETGALDSRYVDRSASVGVSYLYRVRSVDVYGGVGPPSAPVSAVALVPDGWGRRDLFVTVDPDSLDRLNRDVTLDLAIPARFVDGTTRVDATYRYRGDFSRRLNKKSVKVRFPSGHVYGGVDRLNLQAERTDHTLLRDAISYEIFRALGVPTPTTEFVRLHLNGHFRGLHLQVEQVDERFLERNGLSPLGDLYKCYGRFESFDGDTARYASRYDKRTNESTGLHDLIVFIEALNNATPSTLPRVLADNVDLEAMLGWYVGIVLSAQTDFSGENYFAYRDPESEKWTLFPWDLDSGMVHDSLPVDIGTTASPDGNGVGVNVLIDKMLSVPTIRDRYVIKLKASLVTVFTSPDLDPMINALHASLEFDAARDVYRRGFRRTADGFPTGASGLKSFVASRRPFLVFAADGFAPSPEPELIISEVMARNASVVADEFGEFDDWIELRNVSSGPINIFGHALSDDALDPYQWPLPPMVIDAGEHVIVWADDNPAQGAFHAPFKLSGDGEVVTLHRLAAVGGTQQDVLLFGKQYPDVSVGRAGGNPSGEVGLFTSPTPGSLNPSSVLLVPGRPTLTHSPQFPASDEPVSFSISLADSPIASAALYLSVGGAPFQVITMTDDGMSGDDTAGDATFGAQWTAAAPYATYYVEVTTTADVSCAFPIGAPARTRPLVVDFADPEIRLNEFAASNESVPDEFGDTNDWIELTNLGDGSRSLLGLFLTDDVNSPAKWPLPDVSIPAGGYMIVWADGEPFEGPLHAPFSLSSAGEFVGLAVVTPAGMVFVDSLSFESQTTDETMARIPDGIGEWLVVQSITPGAANEDVAVDVPDAADNGRFVRLYPNPTRGPLHIRFPDTDLTSITVFDVAGRRVASLGDGVSRVGSLEAVWDGRSRAGVPLAEGVYFVDVQTHSTRATKKLLIIR